MGAPDTTAADASRPPRIVVGGQVPPPLSGMHVAVQRLLTELRDDPRVTTDHVVYRFAGTMGDQGRPSLAKLAEVVRIWGRLLAARRRGPIDVFLHPIGGTSRGSTIRDLLLVPVVHLVARRVVLQFHGAGHGRVWPGDRSGFVRAARWLLGRSHGAVVHAEANRVDAEFLGIRQVAVVAHRLVDEHRPELVARDDVAAGPRLLYLGHLGAHRGTPQLLRAAATVAREAGPLELELAGEPIRDYDDTQLAADVAAAVAAADGALTVHRPGGVHGEAKDRRFGRAHAFVFPTVFDAESFGLVLVEALMWGLPIVASDWRANAEVVGPDTHAIVHPHTPDLEVALTAALRDAVTRLRDGRWPAWSARNRQRYLDVYRPTPGASPIGDALLAVARSR